MCLHVVTKTTGRRPQMEKMPCWSHSPGGFSLLSIQRLSHVVISSGRFSIQLRFPTERQSNDNEYQLDNSLLNKSCPQVASSSSVEQHWRTARLSWTTAYLSWTTAQLVEQQLISVEQQLISVEQQLILVKFSSSYGEQKILEWTKENLCWIL